MTVEVFKTNVQGNEEANNLAKVIHQHYPESQVNFDLEDCDKILRIAGRQIEPEAIVILASALGYQIEELPD